MRAIILISRGLAYQYGGAVAGFPELKIQGDETAFMVQWWTRYMSPNQFESLYKEALEFDANKHL